MKTSEKKSFRVPVAIRKFGRFLVVLSITCQMQLSHAADSVSSGKALYVSLACASCHAVGPGARAGFGPQLNGVFGRVAGSTIDYKERYSVAMKQSGIVWSEQTLTKFINSPSDLVPGTKMRFWGLSDKKKVADLLAYLRSFPVDPK
ncbi:c-type cytochrome [Undibacterium sp. Xuan67W]|uniref:c-type cytochrome n=1 Tax=Undibacterium sp. Xuan67W TaxID=3413057 RepID=UPI003BF1BE98